MSTTPTVSRVQRVSHEIKHRRVQVARVDTISPHFKSVTFSGESLAGFVSASFDDHVKLVFDAEGESPVRRDYTPRHYDPVAQELTIEFALHGAGHAASWAAQALPGQALTVAGPRGSFVVPTDYDWHLLVGDDSSLPAIHRRLEELPMGSRATVLVQMADAADRRSLHSAADLRVNWVSSAQELLELVRALSLPPGDGYAWGAGEANTMASLRQVLLEEKGLQRHAMRIAAYWTRGAAGHHENLDG